MRDIFGPLRSERHHPAISGQLWLTLRCGIQRGAGSTFFKLDVLLRGRFIQLGDARGFVGISCGAAQMLVTRTNRVQSYSFRRRARLQFWVSTYIVHVQAKVPHKARKCRPCRSKAGCAHNDTHTDTCGASKNSDIEIRITHHDCNILFTGANINDTTREKKIANMGAGEGEKRAKFWAVRRMGVRRRK